MKVEITEITSEYDVPEVLGLSWQLVELPDSGNDVGVLIEIKTETNEALVSHWFVLTKGQAGSTSSILSDAAAAATRIVSTRQEKGR